MRFYSTCGKKIISDDTLNIRILPLIGTTIEDLIAKGVLSEVEPTVEDCVRFGDVGLAVIRHQQVYGSTIQEAFSAVEELKKKRL